MTTNEHFHINLPSFVTFSTRNLSYTIAPTTKDMVGNYTIEVNLVDIMNAESTYYFAINVRDINEPDVDESLRFPGALDQSDTKNGSTKIKT